MRLPLPPRLSVLLAVMASTASCSGGAPVLLPLRCEPLLGSAMSQASPDASSSTAPSADDPLVLHLLLDDPGEGGRVLVRVDALDEEGAVTFETRPPPAAAAVSLASTLSGRFQGCFHEGASGFLLQTPAAPYGRVWLRVSSDRPVLLTVRTGESLVLSDELEVRPGQSGEAVWRSDRP